MRVSDYASFKLFCQSMKKNAGKLTAREMEIIMRTQLPYGERFIKADKDREYAVSEDLKAEELKVAKRSYW